MEVRKKSADLSGSRHWELIKVLSKSSTKLNFLFWIRMIRHFFLQRINLSEVMKVYKVTLIIIRQGRAMTLTGLGRHQVSFSKLWMIQLVVFRHLTVKRRGTVITLHTAFKHFQNFPSGFFVPTSDGGFESMMLVIFFCFLGMLRLTHLELDQGFSGSLMCNAILTIFNF